MRTTLPLLCLSLAALAPIGCVGSPTPEDFVTEAEPILSPIGPRPPPVLRAWPIGLATGPTGLGTYALMSDRTLRAWGNNARGQLGDGTTTGRLAPVRVAGVSNAASLAAGSTHACATLTTSATVCWGDNTYGQLGANLTAAQLAFSTSARAVVGAPALGSFASSGNTTCGIDNNHRAWCWGEGRALGTGNTASNALSPVAGGNGLLALFAGAGSFFAEDLTDRMYVWGDNANNKLGVGASVAVVASPTNIGRVGYRSPAASLYGACMYNQDGLVECNPLFGGRVAGLGRVKQVVMGGMHACALLDVGGDEGGPVRCWGDNTYSQMGDPAAPSGWVASPVEVVQLQHVVSLVAGYAHTCALTADSSVYCWGFNSSGQIGDGTTARATYRARVTF